MISNVSMIFFLEFAAAFLIQFSNRLNVLSFEAQLRFEGECEIKTKSNYSFSMVSILFVISDVNCSHANKCGYMMFKEPLKNEFINIFQTRIYLFEFISGTRTLVSNSVQKKSCRLENSLKCFEH